MNCVAAFAILYCILSCMVKDGKAQVNRPEGYGFTKELMLGKKPATFDPALELDARRWMKDIVGEPIEQGLDPSKALGSKEFTAKLKDGMYLCKLVNVLLEKNDIKKATCTESSLPFKRMENIGKFLDGANRFGVAKSDLFQTVDLYANKNPAKVVNGILALKRKAVAKGL